METQLLGGASSGGPTSETPPPAFLRLPRHPPRKVGRRCWRPRRRAPSSPSLRRGDSASLPGRLSGGAGERRTPTPASRALLGPRAPQGSGRPSPTGPVQRVPRRPRLPASASGAVLSGPGGGASPGAAPPPRPPPAPEVPPLGHL
ncbi:proline-rich protein HaeIII subfamily 1-like [Sapajus apella]|uniref:Proline-rich protein HaeIII subfamily 1-like n=1 Tax=Sapajus apella TaxID=9515 RepID=A0A6J3GPB9_SAPAP|nr:proline-rich protein HaeIII subfamily 1-like [Sapajus apella]